MDVSKKALLKAARGLEPGQRIVVDKALRKRTYNVAADLNMEYRGTRHYSASNRKPPREDVAVIARIK